MAYLSIASDSARTNESSEEIDGLSVGYDRRKMVSRTAEFSVMCTIGMPSLSSSALEGLFGEGMENMSLNTEDALDKGHLWT